MAQAKAIMKALRVRKILQRMARVKEDSIREMVGLPPVMSFKDQCMMTVSSAIRECLCRAFCPCCVTLPTFGEICCPRFSFRYRLCADGEYPNDVIKSFIGFFSGLLLTMGIFLFLSLQLEANMEYSLVLCVILGLVLSLGLAFSSAVRCLVLLALPTTCSSKGRSFLIMYALVLIMNHPVQNFSHNLGVLTDAATCGQHMALNETKKLVQAAASPLLSVVAGVKKMLVSVRVLADTLRKAFKALMRAIEEVVAVIGRVIKWLGSMVDVCNANMGRPYRKCKKAFEDGYDECKSALGILDFLCSIVTAVSQVCHLARIGELLCIIAGAIKDLALSKLAPKISIEVLDVRKMFQFNVSMKYHYHYTMNQSRSYDEIRDAIFQEIRSKLDGLDIVKTVVDNVMSLTVLLIIIKAVLYRRSYLHKDGFDNYYITRHLFEIDSKRLEAGKESIMPLKNIEKLKYVPTLSYMVIEKEAKTLIKGLLFWCFAAFHASYYIVCDYGLYWILDMVRRHMALSTRMAIPAHLKLHVKGQQPLSDMYKSIVGIAEPVSDSGLDVDTNKCLPNPGVPNYEVYKTVTAILGICLFLTIFEVYGLRLRHVVGACYYPHREKVRAVWLYNHIMLMRGDFVAFTRKQLHRKKGDKAAAQRMSIKSRLVAQFPWLKYVMQFLGHHTKRCLSCAMEGRADDMDSFVHCDQCDSPYCNDCYADLGNLCTACMSPVDYGDVDDESVETDSSEDEKDKALRVARLKAKKARVVEKKEEKQSSNLVKAFQQRFAGPDSNVQFMSRQGNVIQDPESASSDEDEEEEDDENESASLLKHHRKEDRSEPVTSRPTRNVIERSRAKTGRRVDMVTLDIFH